MVVFSPVAQQPSSGIEDRLQAIQEILRPADHIDDHIDDLLKIKSAPLFLFLSLSLSLSLRR